MNEFVITNGERIMVTALTGLVTMLSFGYSALLRQNKTYSPDEKSVLEANQAKAALVPPIVTLLATMTYSFFR